MPRATKTLVLGDELDALDERLDDLADQEAETTPGTDEYRDIVTEGAEVESDLRALEWAVHGHGEEGFDGYGADAEVVLRELDTDDYAEFVDRLEEARDQQQSVATSGGGTGQAELFWCAAAIDDAPFGISPSDSFVQRLNALRGPDAPKRQFVSWIKAEAQAYNTLSGNGQGRPSFSERCTGTTTSPDTPRSSPPEQS